MRAALRHPGASWDLVRQGSRLKEEAPGFHWGDVARLWLAALLLLFAAPAFAQSFPAFTGLVTDAAGVLPGDRKATLEKTLEDFQQRTGRQLVVATIPDLQGYDIADYGYRLGRSWGVGLKGADNGAILIVAPKERKVRIEVGYRLEPVLTDAWSSVAIQQTIIPAFKAGDIPGGIEAGAAAIVAQLGLPDDQAKAQVAKAAADFDKTHARRRNGSGGVPLGLIFWLFVAGFVALAYARRRQGPWRRQRYDAGGGGGNWPIWLWAASEIGRAIQNRDNDDHGSGGGFLGGGGSSGGGSDGSWGGGGFTGGGGGSFGGGGASGSW